MPIYNLFNFGDRFEIVKTTAYKVLEWQVISRQRGCLDQKPRRLTEAEPKSPFSSTESFELLRTHSVHFRKTMGIFRLIFNFFQKWSPHKKSVQFLQLHLNPLISLTILFINTLWWVTITRDKQNCHKLYVTDIKIMGFWQSYENIIPHATHKSYKMCKLPSCVYACER